jgi:hypothetical protein
MVNLISIARVNQVIILDNPDEVENWKCDFNRVINSDYDGVSLLWVSCSGCGDAPVPPVCIATRFFFQISERLRVSWWRNPLLWLQLQRWRKPFTEAVLDSIKDIDSFSDLEGVLAYHSEDIKAQIKKITKIEKSEYVIFVFEHFEKIDQQNQPATAGLIHRLLKNTPAYFRLISLGEPLLFRKDGQSEIGIQRDHDYGEIKQSITSS